MVTVVPPALAAGRKDTATAADVLATIKAICTHPLPATGHAAA